MNKCEEALNDLYRYLTDEMVEAPFLFRSCLDTLKDYTEKYRWHNLMEDHNDLPEIGTQINVVFEIKYRRHLDKHYVAYKVDEDCLNTLRRGYAGDFVLLAWRYIEQFDDTKKEDEIYE